MPDVQSTFDSLIRQLLGGAQKRPDLGGSWGGEDYLGTDPIATFAGRMVKPGDTAKSALSRMPVGEVEGGGQAMGALPQSLMAPAIGGTFRVAYGPGRKYFGQDPVAQRVYNQIEKRPEQVDLLPFSALPGSGKHSGALGMFAHPGHQKSVGNVHAWENQLEVPTIAINDPLMERAGRDFGDPATYMGGAAHEGIHALDLLPLGHEPNPWVFRVPDRKLTPIVDATLSQMSPGALMHILLNEGVQHKAKFLPRLYQGEVMAYGLEDALTPRFGAAAPGRREHLLNILGPHFGLDKP